MRPDREPDSKTSWFYICQVPLGKIGIACWHSVVFWLINPSVHGPFRVARLGRGATCFPPRWTWVS